MQLIIFRLNDEFYAFDTEVVENINDIMKITKIPKAPSYIKGLINLRGNVISLIDLKLLLNLNNSDAKSESIIILKLEEESVGALVDEVDEVIDIEKSMIEKVENKQSKAISGVININGKIITLIDVNKLI